MAGYMTILKNNVYDGSFVNGAAAPVENGTLMVLDTTGTKLVLPAADKTTKFLCKEATTLYDGIAAYDVMCTDATKLYFLVENQFDINDSEAYDTTKYATPVGALLRAHPVEVGETMRVTSSETLTAGTSYGVKATGVVGETL